MGLSNDPVLNFVKGITRAIESMLILIALVASTVLIYGLVSPGSLVDLIGEHYPGTDAGAIREALLLALAPGTAAAVLGAAFLNLMARVIGSTREGTPFRSANVGRLRSMAWLAIGFTSAGMLLALAQRGLAETITGTNQRLHLDYGGLVMALALFALARVFEVGVSMQEDLEGTV